MRLVNYNDQRETSEGFRTGFLVDDRVVDFGRVRHACTGVSGGCGCAQCWQSALGLAMCEDCLDAARGYAEWVEAQDEAALHSLSAAVDAVKLLSPVPSPPKMLCLAQNFPSHAAESSTHITHSGESVADRMTPHVFMKPSTNTVCGQGDPIVIPRLAQFIDYEAEVVAVIGKRGKYIAAADAMSYVAGVTAMNDVSERDLMIWERKDGREWDSFFDWLNGKWMDSFAPMGPCLVPTGDLDVDDLDLRCLVNGEVRQVGNTSEMFHSVAQTIVYVSSILTLEPGDVIAMGTPGGVGKAIGIKLAPGDVVTVEVEGVGALTNPVVAE